MSNRERLPSERSGITHKFVIKDVDLEGHIEEIKGYLTVNMYPDGRVGEIFLKMDKQGGQVSGFCDAFSIAFSMLLQSGTPLEELCRKYRGASFRPSGYTDNKNIRQARSPVDYVARYLEMRFVDTELVDDDEEEVVPPKTKQFSATHPGTCTACGRNGPLVMFKGKWLHENCAEAAP
jgi:hypothetical protein